jgi:response regulator of citrate/malate metabolism
MPQDVRDSMDAGFMDHLVKPVRFEQLEAVLRKIAAARGEPKSATMSVCER